MRYETWAKGDNGKYFFIGWYEMKNEEYVIETKQKGKFLYKTYKYASGDIETLRYTIA